MGTMTHYHAGTNMPGYQPGGDVSRFDNSDSAWAAVSDELQRHWDDEYHAADARNEGDAEDLSQAKLAIDARYLPAHGGINYVGPSGHVTVPGPTDTSLGRVYFVQECTDDCPEDE